MNPVNILARLIYLAAGVALILCAYFFPLTCLGVAGDIASSAILAAAGVVCILTATTR